MQISKGKHQIFVILIISYVENGLALQLELDNIFLCSEAELTYNFFEVSGHNLESSQA
jgi:hypothetical protein